MTADKTLRSSKTVFLYRCGFSISAILPLLLAFATSGCGPQKVPSQPPVDQKKGLEALSTTVDAWKAGKKPEDLGNQSPKILVQDLEWTGGAKLLDYKVTDKVSPVDHRLFVDVQLEMVKPDGKTVQKTVKYQMNT